MSTVQRCDRLSGGAGTTWDFWEGFNGKMSQYEFKLVGKKEQLVPLQASSEAQMGKHMAGVDQYFQKRTCYIIEAKPKSANVVYSKFRFWMEDTCWLPFYGEAFDLRGNLWQMNNFNQCWDINWMPYALNMMCPIDLQRTHSTTSLMSDAILNKEFKPEFFSLNKLKKYYAGR